MNNPTLAQGARLTAVRLKNAAGEEIGKVIEWLMDVEQGKVVYVVAEFHAEAEAYAIPWGLMKADLEKGGYIVNEENIKKHKLLVDRNSLGDLATDKSFLGKVFNTYNLPMYTAQNEVGRTPSTASSGERQDPNEGTYPSNAEVSEGKGYGR